MRHHGRFRDTLPLRKPYQMSEADVSNAALPKERRHKAAQKADEESVHRRRLSAAGRESGQARPTTSQPPRHDRVSRWPIEFRRG